MLLRSTTTAPAAPLRLGLPPRLRPHIYRNARSRPLNPPQARCMSAAEHLTSAGSFADGSFADGSLKLCLGLFEVLHNCGLSWAVALPAGALLVRACIITPFLQIPARKAQQTTTNLLPIMQAHAIVRKHSTHLRLYHEGAQKARNVSRTETALFNHKIKKRWRAQPWKHLLPLCGLPIFVAMAETIRRMVGTRSGLWGLVFGSGSYQSEAPKTSDALGKDDATIEGVADTLKGATPDTAVVSDWIQPSLATEGMLWFPDLMAPDPLLILPFVVSGVTVCSLYVSSRAPGRRKQKPAWAVIRRIMMTIALAIGPLTLNMPAGILLYWTASTSFALMSNLYLDRFLPIRMPPKPCKRSIPYLPKKKAQQAGR
ncbi:mitochondrial inner membrane protein oxa1l-like [Diplodia corticola]|uniref:Mitochondrial inner membrane protein oxa1l-like n=1 Tax=Diplodia corticola TaxID=236234 RepID=A0A1J9S0N0_9PEZI|nr:mitochondrial inner membrane protein oxa1l-like [Diplodia corticola]OJD33580.1 mitochondrial inner membrane protein oxa1l-like [Diplodia corticola]